MKTVKTKATAKKSTKKVTTKKTAKAGKMTFNKYSIYFQSISMLLLIVALTLNICCYISMNVMLDLFSLSIISLAFSLFPKKA